METTIDDPYAAARISRALGESFDGRPVVFACIGTDRSTGDAFGPLVGERLRSLGAEVLGTLEQPLHALNLAHRMSELTMRDPEALIVAIDAALGPKQRVGRVAVRNHGINPGRAIGKDLGTIGDVSITATVNVASETDRERVLQSTRLFFVARMSQIVATACDYALEDQRARTSPAAA